MATGLGQYVRWDAIPTSATPLTAFGLGATGGDHEDTAEPGERNYAGGSASLFGVMKNLRGRVDFDVTDDTVVTLADRNPTGIPRQRALEVPRWGSPTTASCTTTTTPRSGACRSRPKWTAC